MNETTQHTDRQHTADEYVIEEYVEAPPREVFDYVADPERRPFGRDERLTLGEERRRETPSRIEWDAEWRTADADGSRRTRTVPGSVEVALTPDGTGTHVRVTHRFALASPEARVRMLALAA
jgi:uncharacterized protein YndB with AHSA1/START domain